MKNSRTLKVIPNCQNLENNFPLLFLEKKKKKLKKKKMGIVSSFESDLKQNMPNTKEKFFGLENVIKKKKQKRKNNQIQTEKKKK